MYFYDPGLVCWLLSISTAEQLNLHPMRGAIFESFILSELIKHRFNKGERADVHFWRDKQGLEVDVVYEAASQLSGIEIKSGGTFNPGFTDHLTRWHALCGKRAGNAALVYAGNESFTFRDVRVIGWLDPALFDAAKISNG